MKNETFFQILEELKEKKKEIAKENERINCIKTLEKTKKIIEYLKLTNSSINNEQIIDENDHKYIMEIFKKHLYEINEKDTNGIYVYLGTYSKSITDDIEHGCNDRRVAYNSGIADYRLYEDLEQQYPIKIQKDQCNEFENKHTIINPKSYFAEVEYYKLQEEFIVTAIENGQENAKKSLLATNRLLRNKKINH